MAKAKSKRPTYRRKSDGFRVQLSDAELAGVLDPEDYELLSDFTKRDLAPPKPAAAEPPPKVEEE